MPTCYAKGCRNASANGVKMNAFPRDPTRRLAWIRNCKNYGAITRKLPNDFSSLCEYHFTADMWEKPRVDGKKKLKLNAEPIIFGDLVVQITEKVKDIPKKVGYLNTVAVRTNPDTKDIQILTKSDQKYKMLPVNDKASETKKLRIRVDTSKDLYTKENEQVSSIANKNKSLLLNNNVISRFTEDESSEFTIESISGNNSDTELAKVKQEIQKDYKENDFISDSNFKQEEDSETDSFINKNFEPVTDDEIDFKTEDNGNFGPIKDEETDSSDFELEEEVEENKSKTSISTEENLLYIMQKILKNTSHKTDEKCSRCETLEKVYQKSERVRIMMKKRYKHSFKKLKRQIKMLESKVQILEGNQIGLHKIFNEDQIDFLCRNQKKNVEVV